jgi:HEAT repeat protein
MTRTGSSGDEIAPLVLELARALRARRVHPTGHPVVVDALKRAAAMLRAIASSDSRIAIDVAESGLSLDGTALVCPGAAELATELRARRVTRLSLTGVVELQDLSHLLETLSREPDELAAAGGAAESLRAAGARAIELAVPQPKPKPAPAPAPPLELQTKGSDPFLTQQIADLVRLLAEMERCDDFGGYNLLANKVDTCIDALIRAKRCLDAYRAAVVYTRHATDKGVRTEPIRREAADRLRRMACNEAMLDAIVEQACSPSALASVQASQVLIAIGSPAVVALLSHCANAKDPSRERAAAALIAMGDDALSGVVDELRSGVTDRARRAARLLGEMQNPRGVQFLADALRSSDAQLGKEAARALAKISSDASVAALVQGLRLAPAIAEVCAGALGGMRQASAARALGELLDLEKEYPDGLRREAIRSLGRLASVEALNRLKRVLDHAPFFGRNRFRALRIAAAQAIGQIGGPVAIQTLAPHARGGDPDVRQACQEAVRRIERGAAGT